MSCSGLLADKSRKDRNFSSAGEGAGLLRGWAGSRRQRDGHPMRTTRAIWLFSSALILIASLAHAQVLIRITTPPPPLPAYVQPVIPGPDFICVPGYWAWGEFGYVWVPGTWVRAPTPGLLWTPGYWAWSEGLYVWRAGYWGPRVGFYGGVNYGFGYTGVGYQRGYWRDRACLSTTPRSPGSAPLRSPMSQQDGCEQHDRDHRELQRWAERIESAADGAGTGGIPG